MDRKQRLLKLRRRRTRKKVAGSKERPRMSVKFSGKHIYVQFVDDDAGVTLASTSTLSKNNPDKGKLSANMPSASKLGTLAAQVAGKQGIQRVVFDRSGARYHGKVKALADAAREGGLQF